MTKDSRLSAEQKIEIIHTAEKIGLRQTEKLYGVTKKTIIGWKKKLQTGGETALNTASRENQPHPARIPAETRSAIKNLAAEFPGLSAMEIIRRLNLTCSIPSVLKILREENKAVPEVNTRESSVWYLNAIKTPLMAAGKPVYLLTAMEESSEIILPVIAFENIPIYLNKFVKFICNFLHTANELAKFEIVTINGRFRSGCSKNPVDGQIIELFPDITFSTADDNEIHTRAIRNLLKMLPKSISSLATFFQIFQRQIFEKNLTTIVSRNLHDRLFLLGFQPVNINLDFYDRAASLIEKKISLSEIITSIMDLIDNLNREDEMTTSCNLLSYLENSSSLITADHHKIRLLQLQGDCLFKRYEYNKAKEKYLKAANLAKTYGNLEMQLSLDIDLARYYYRVCRFKRSESILVKAIKKAEENNFKRAEAKLYNVLGTLYQINNDHKTKAAYEKVFSIAMEIDDRNLYCSALNKLAGFYLKTGEYNKCLQTAEKSLAIAQKDNDFHHLYNASSKIAEHYLFTHKFPEAEHQFAIIRQLAVEHNRKHFVTDATAYLGYAQFRQGKIDIGLLNMEKAQAQAKEIDDIYREQLVYALLGQSYQVAADFKKAVYYFNKAIKINLIISNPEHLTTIYGNLIACYNELGKYHDALKYAKMRYGLVKLSTNKFQIAISLGKIGSCALNLKDYEQAFSAYNEQLKLLKNTDATFNKALALSNLGHTYLETKDYPQAKCCYLKAEKLFAALNNQRYVVRLYLKLTETALLQDCETDIKKYAALSREKAAQLNDQSILKQLDDILAQRV